MGLLPLALKLTFEGGEYIARLALKHDVPPANRSNMTPDKFECGEAPLPEEPGSALSLVRKASFSQLYQLAVFPFPSPHQSPAMLEDRGWTLVPTCGSEYTGESQNRAGQYKEQGGAVGLARPKNALKQREV